MPTKLSKGLMNLLPLLQNRKGFPQNTKKWCARFFHINEVKRVQLGVKPSLSIFSQSVKFLGMLSVSRIAMMNIYFNSVLELLEVYFAGAETKNICYGTHIYFLFYKISFDLYTVMMNSPNHNHSITGA